MSIHMRGLREDELDLHNRLIYESYREYDRHDDGDTAWWRDIVSKDPYYRPEQTRVLLADGEMVASVTNFQREMHCGGARAKVSAIGSVATHPDHRRRGHIRTLLEDCRQWMADNHFDFCFLFGAEGVYGGSGWRFLSGLDTLATLRTPTESSGLTVRPALIADDAPALCAIHAEFNQPLTGTFVRSEAYWRTRIPTGYFSDRSNEFYLIEDAGRPVAYYRSTGPGRVDEVGWLRDGTDLPERVIAAILTRWPDAPETRFAFCTRELLAALDPFIWASTGAEWKESPASLRLVEAPKGLWTYIGPGRGQFPQITDTDSLLRFLRQNEYVFWSGSDSF